MAITKRYKTFDKSWMIEMALQKFRNSIKEPAIAAALSATLLGGFASAAHADNDNAQYQLAANTAAYTQTLEERNSASIRAGEFSDQDRNNIGIILYYGAGNKGTPDQFGDYMAQKIEERAQELGHNFDAQHFVLIKKTGKEGIAVEFVMGPMGIDDMDYMAALNSLDDIINKRIEANEALEQLDKTYQGLALNQ